MKQTQKLTLAAMFLALGLILPFFTGQIPQIGSMLLPMHLPVFLCGLICGWEYGLVVGAILPLLRSTLFGMPPMFPTAIAMAFELATYGLLSGLLYTRAKKQNVMTVYGVLLAAMVGGRVVWGVTQLCLLSIKGGAFTWEMFIAGALVNAIPGIIVQLILIPVVMVALDKAKIVKFRQS